MPFVARWALCCVALLSACANDSPKIPAANAGAGGASTSDGGRANDEGGALGAAGNGANTRGGTSGANAGSAGSGARASDPTDAAGSGGSGGAAAALTPTVSSWLGSNVSGDLPRVDISYQLKPFDTPIAQQDSNGYPLPGVSGVSSTDLGFVLPSGTYELSFKGTGKLTVSGIGALVNDFQTVNGEQRAELKISGSPGNFGQFLTLAVNNAAGETVTDVHLLYPGFDHDSSALFLPQFIALLKPFRALRFMDWESTNNSSLSNWADRPAAAHFGQSPFGEPDEHIAALLNQTGKDAWLTIPEHATDDYVRQFARFLAQSLDFEQIQKARTLAGFQTPFQIILENSNETWNSGFSAYSTFLAAAQAEPARYTGAYTGSYGPSWMSGNTDLMKVGQYQADRLLQEVQIFRSELGPHADSLSPVLSGWALGAAYSDVGLRFIEENYGDPKTFIKYVAMAPYFGADDAQSSSLADLFSGMAADIAAKDASYADFARLVDEWGLSMAAYEGGQGLSGPTNQALKHLAQHDQRMYDTYQSYFALWQKHFGQAPFMHFSLAGNPGVPESIYQYGYWGSIIGVLEDPVSCANNLPTLLGTESIASVVHHCPKYRALAERVP